MVDGFSYPNESLDKVWTKKKVTYFFKFYEESYSQNGKFENQLLNEISTSIFNID